MTRRATGPITDEGKAISAQNARRQGLNAPPDQGLATAWLNVILNSVEGTVEDSDAGGPRREAALKQAIAEARYHRALHKVDTHDRELNSAQQVANNLHADIDNVLDGTP